MKLLLTPVAPPSRPVSAGNTLSLVLDRVRTLRKASFCLAGLLGTFLVLSLTPEQAARAATEPPAGAATGMLTGTVSNPATGNLLEGAKVELVRAGLSTLTDNTGRYMISAVPGGAHEIVVSYLGLDSVRDVVTIVPGGRAVRNFDLKTEIYTLAEFKVVGEREGDALAITAQRNAGNVKNVVAMDSFGNLPNMNAGELMLRLPGVTSIPTDEDLNNAPSIRGMTAQLNTVTMDGDALAGRDSRAFRMHTITVGMFEQMELIKGHTPDKEANSLGGSINLKTRSPLNMREKRRINYSLQLRTAPPFTDQIPLREAHRTHPLLMLGYQEVFSVFGGERNLGIAANLFYSQNAVGYYQVAYNWQNTLASPAYVWSYQANESFNNRKQESVNVKADYRLSAGSRLSLTLTWNDNTERHRRTYTTRLSTGSATTVPNATTSGVIPGFTDKITEVRPVAASVVDVSTAGPNAFVDELVRTGLAGEHDVGRLQIDWIGSYSRNDNTVGRLPEGGQIGITNRLTNVGWILDRTKSDRFPRLIQTAGPDWSDPANYRPTANSLYKTSNGTILDTLQLRANFKYALPTAIKTQLKTGVAWRELSIKRDDRGTRRWTYLGTKALPVDADAAAQYATLKTGVRFPRWQVSDFMAGRQGGDYPADASLWREDDFYREQNRYVSTRGGKEEVKAAYLMAQGAFGRDGWLGRTSYLTGVRVEKTATEGWGWVRARFASTTAQQQADPVGTADRDYANNYRRVAGSYTESFPSVHLSHDVTPNLRARVSWSTSFGRPALSNFFPNETVSESNQTVTINNPGLLPQKAKNWDATLEYYFQSVGMFSVGWFHKNIRDYIISGINAGIVPGGNDNGYSGEYEGFTRLTTANAGTAVVNGWEFSYQHQFTFLPGLLKGLGGSVNYTILETEGNFGSASTLRTNQVSGFIPRTGNVSLSWRYRGFNTRVLYNYAADHISALNAASPALNTYRAARNLVNLSLAYQVRPALAFTCDVTNIFNEKQRIYMAGIPDRINSLYTNFTTVTFGVNGQF
jgi:iron complex outermembrane receptor protein